MAITVRPTRVDLAIAKAVARNTSRAPEEISQALTWGADEHVLAAAAVLWWLWTRTRPADERSAGDHVLCVTVATAILPHILKRQFNQIRPDRKTVRGHLHGVPLSGNAYDAFPSGHAMHVGALASAASRLPPSKRNVAWAVGSALVSTRIVLLAHWTSDVVVGLAMGALLERALRFMTGYGRGRSKPRCTHRPRTGGRAPLHPSRNARRQGR
jgi:hypothetical protein